MMGCPFDGKCRDDCETCIEEGIRDKFAALIDQARDRLDELESCQSLIHFSKMKIEREVIDMMLETLKQKPPDVWAGIPIIVSSLLKENEAIIIVSPKQYAKICKQEG